MRVTQYPQLRLSQLRLAIATVAFASHLRRSCGAFAADKTGSPLNNPKKDQDPAQVAGGYGFGVVKYGPRRTMRKNDIPDGPVHAQGARA